MVIDMFRVQRLVADKSRVCLVADMFSVCLVADTFILNNLTFLTGVGIGIGLGLRIFSGGCFKTTKVNKF